LNELWSILAGVAIAAMPVAAPPAVQVSLPEVEQSIQASLEKTTDFEVSVNCGATVINMAADSTHTLTCSILNEKTGTEFPVSATLVAEGEKVQVKAVVKENAESEGDNVDH